MTPRRDPAGIAAVLVASTVWGASFVLAKMALSELAVAHLLLYRFVFAVLPFLPVLLLRAARPSGSDLWLFALTGFLMVPVTFLLQVGGLVFTSATSAALLIGTGAPLLAVAAVVFERERLGRRGWFAVAISCFGVALLVGIPGAGDDWRGNLMVFVSMVVSTAWVIMSKRLVGRYPAVHATGWILLFGTLFLVPISLVWAGLPPVNLSTGVWASLLALGLGCTTLSYVIWNWGVARVGAGSAGVYLNFEPIAGALLGVTLLGDSLGVGMVAGGTAILAAAGIISMRPKGASSEAGVVGERRRWWREGRPSLQAEFALRLYGLGETASRRPTRARRRLPRPAATDGTRRRSNPAPGSRHRSPQRVPSWAGS